MKKRLTLSTAAALLTAALPASAGVSIDRASQSISACGFPVNPAQVLSLGPPGGGCDMAFGLGPVAEVKPLSMGLNFNDNVDGLSANTLTPETLTYHLVFSADPASAGQVGTPYFAEAGNNQAASDLWRTSLTGGSPAAGMAGGGCVPFVVPPPHSLHRNQTAFNLIQSAPAGTAVAAPLDNVDAVELDALDINGDRIHDLDVYFSLDPVSPNLVSSGADIYFAPAGAGFGVFSLPAQIGLVAGDDIDSLVIWDRGTIGIPDPGVDFALFSLAPGSPTLAAFGVSPAMIFVTHFSGTLCPYVGPGELGLRLTDNVDGLDVLP